MKYKLNSSRIFFSIIKFYNFLAFFSNKFDYLLYNNLYKKKSKKNKIKQFPVSPENDFFFFLYVQKFITIKYLTQKFFHQQIKRNK